MTDASSAQLPVTANFINPETMHHPAGYTHAVEVTAGRPVYIAGQVALDPTGALVGPGDIRAQARQVVKLTYYLVDATQLPMVREVRDQYVNIQQPPASTAVEVRRLAWSGWPAPEARAAQCRHGHRTGTDPYWEPASLRRPTQASRPGPPVARAAGGAGHRPDRWAPTGWGRPDGLLGPGCRGSAGPPARPDRPHLGIL